MTIIFTLQVLGFMGGRQTGVMVVFSIGILIGFASAILWGAAISPSSRRRLTCRTLGTLSRSAASATWVAQSHTVPCGHVVPISSLDAWMAVLVP